MRRLKFGRIALRLLGARLFPSTADRQAVSGTISVSDPERAAIPGAEVVVTRPPQHTYPGYVSSRLISLVKVS